MSQAIIHSAQSIRGIILKHVQAIPEDVFDIQPRPFRNTIRWNVGHIVLCAEHFMSLCVPIHSGLPDSYAGLFNTGTKPSDWTMNPPSKDELVQYLSGQFSRLSEIAPDALDKPLQSPVVMGSLRFETAGELFNFSFMHEAIHHGAISSLLKVIEAERQQ